MVSFDRLVLLSHNFELVELDTTKTADEVKRNIESRGAKTGFSVAVASDNVILDEPIVRLGFESQVNGIAAEIGFSEVLDFDFPAYSRFCSALVSLGWRDHDG